MPVLSPDMNYIAFTSKSGKIWRMSIQDTISEFIDITPGDTTELNIFAGWSPNGKYIIFNRYFTDITQQQLSALCLAEVVDGKPLITLLSNNVYRGYWSRISN